MFILAQVFIAMSSILYGLSGFAKNKLLLFLTQTCSSILYFAYLFMLNAWVGAVVTAFDILRSIIFYFIEKKGGGQRVKICVASALFIIAIICSVFTWEGWFSILPLFGTLFYITSIAVSKLALIKGATLLTAVCSTLYLVFDGSTFGVICESIAATIALFGLIKALFFGKNKKIIDK